MSTRYRSVQLTTVQKPTATLPVVGGVQSTPVPTTTVTTNVLSNTTTASSNTVITPVSETTTTTTTNTVVKSQTFVTDSAIPFMRAKTVQFKAEGLKPNTRYYPFFNRVYVGDYCSTQSAVQSSAIFTDSLGNVKGNFYLPGGTFSCGQHKFELVDHVYVAGDKTQADALYSSAAATYTANGILRLQQTQITTTTTVTVDTVTTPIKTVVQLCNKWEYQYSISRAGRITTYARSWVDTVGTTPPAVALPTGLASGDIYTVVRNWFIVEQNTACPLVRGYAGEREIARVDPVAQSFTLDTLKYPNGAFMTSIDVYFRSVDQSTPVFLELRNMVNGLPGPAILPGGNAIVPGYAAAQSLNATVPTTFRFDHPIYLLPGQDYCIVLKTPSMGYNAWVSKFGSNDVTTAQRIVTQPLDGVLFKSANNVTWEPDSTTDLKCTMRVASFDSTVQANILFRPQRRVLAANKMTIGKTYRIETLGTTSWAAFTGISGTYNVGDLITVTTIPTSTVSQGNGTAYDIYYNLSQSLPLSYISTTAGSDTVTITIPMHGLQNTDYIYIDDLPDRSYNGITAANLLGEFSVSVVDEDTVTITAKNSNAANLTGDILVTEAKRVLDTLPPPPLVDQTFTPVTAVTNIDNNSPSTIPGATGLPASPTLVGGKAVFGATAINTTTNVITLSGYVFTTGDHVVYSSNGDTAPGGLTSGASYYVKALTDNTVRLYNTQADSINDTDGSLALDLSAGATGLYHTLTIVTTQVDISHFTVLTNLRIDEAMIDYLGTEIDGTTITENVSIADINYNDQPYDDYGKTGEFFEYDTARILANPKNEYENRVTMNNLPSLRVNMLMDSNNQFASPIIDQRGMSLVTRTYRIDNQADELESASIVLATEMVAGEPYMIVAPGNTDFTAVGAPSSAAGTCFIATGAGTGSGTVYYNSEIVPGSGTAAAKYKSTVNLIDTDRVTKYNTLSVYVVGTCPAPSGLGQKAVIDCYVRTSSDESTHRDLNWNWVPIQGVFGTAFQNSLTSKSMTEWRYDFVAPTFFNVFDVKLVMRSTNTAVVPKIHSIRTIANKV